MQRLKQFTAILLMALLTISLALAQDAPRAANQAVAQDVTIIIQQQQVRFAAQRVVEQLHLQVTNQAGEAVFDSGAAGVQEIFWPLQQAHGAALKSGLYAYTLTIKEQGASAARTRRGHFIVDRAQDRDGADKLWVTSANSDGVGTELTVARDENATIAGTTLSSERTIGQRTESQSRGNSDRGIETGTQNQTLETKTATTAVVAGTAGYIAKFTSASDLGNSVLAESNGNLGVGTASPTSKLDVRGNFTLDPGSSPVFYTAASGGEQNRFLQLINSPVHRSASGLKAGGVLIADNYNFGNPGKNDLVVKGRIGIGTATPVSSLEIAGYSPFITLRETQQGRDEPSYIQNAGGSLVFKPTGSGYATAAMVMQANTLNVGIGTATPGARLDVASGSGDILRLTGYEPFITFYDSNHGYQRGAIQQVAGGLNLFADSYLRGGNPFAYLRLDNSGNVGIGNATPQAKLDVAGQTRTQSLQITGGADFAEHFDVNVAETATLTKVEAGMVVSIDPASPGKLALSRQAYDRRVAGIISGAGGVKPGMTMSQEGTLADGQHPVALSGRVYCWVDATRGAVKPGDLLTTSPTPGHAMKVANAARAQGAIIGKAMTGLKQGKGLVLVLVNLQ